MNLSYQLAFTSDVHVMTALMQLSIQKLSAIFMLTEIR
jgi:hypothetical protein